MKLRKPQPLVFLKNLTKTNSNGTDGERQKFEFRFNPRRSIGIRLFLYFFVVINVLVSTVGFISFAQSGKLIENQAANSQQLIAVQAGEKLSLVLSRYEATALEMSISSEVMNLESSVRQHGNDIIAQMEVRSALQSKMTAYSFADASIEGLYLLAVQDDLPSYTTKGIIPANYQDFEWYQRAVESGSGFWIATEGKGPSGMASEPALGYVRVVRSQTSLQTLYVLLLEVKERRIQEVIGDALGEGGTVYLVDKDNKVLSSPNKADIAQPLLVELVGESEEGGSFRQPVEGDEKLFVYSNVEGRGWKIVGMQSFAPLIAGTNSILALTSWMIFFGAIAATLIGLMMAKQVASPIKYISKLMAKAGEGDLNIEAPYRGRKDEIGSLANGFQNMIANIRALVMESHESVQEVLRTASELSEASNRTATSAKEIAIATEQIALGSSNVAVEAERVTDVTGILGSKMEQTVQAYEQMATVAADIRKSSEQGTVYMEELSVKTTETEKLTQSMVRKVEELQQSTGSILDILAMLNDIAKQTNILSLNATIEAARAGEAGRGFMVVADEIRKLADQSKQSIGTVGTITDRIRSEIDETVRLMEQAYPMFQEQISSVKQSNEIFITVNDRMGGFVEQLDSITEAVQQLESTQQTLADAMSSVSAVAEQSSASTEEVAGLSTEQLQVGESLVQLAKRLDEVSNRLRDTLNNFRL